MDKGDNELMHWIMVHGKGSVRYDALDEYWHEVRSVLMSKGYMERFNLYQMDRPAYYVTSTGLYRLNQLQKAEERRNKVIARLKLKSKE